MRAKVTMRTAMLGAAAACASAAAQTPPPTPPQAPCTASEYGQLDFWIGHWSLTNQGKPAGQNRIEKILDGCALLESWQSVGKHRGNSLTFYDAARGVWHQTWIDVNGQPLYLEGRFENGRMRLEGTRPGQGRDIVQHRIEWIPLPEGRLRQRWQSSTDGGKTWTDVFDGYYEKASG